MKINLGSSKLSKSLFPISFDSSSTTNFGECIPNFCQEVVSDSHVNIDLRQGVRFAPLTLPTFGKAFLHSYAFYHKFVDLWCPFNDFLAQTPFTTSSGSAYVPKEVPSIFLDYLWFIVLNHSTFSYWKIDTQTVRNPAGSPLNVGHFSVSPVSISPSQVPLGITRGLVRTVAAALASSPDSFVPYLEAPGRKTNLIYGLTSPAPCTYIQSTDDSPITPAGSDFMFICKSNSVYVPNGTQWSAINGSTQYLCCLKLNNSGKFLRKIFLGLGYHLKNSHVSVSVLPLIAYFKSYFQTFAPKRFIKYDQTSFGRVMSSVINLGRSFSDVLFSDSYTTSSLLPDFIDDLLSCYYTQDTDYYSSQILGLTNDYGSSLSQPYLGVDVDTSEPRQSVLRSYPTLTDVPGINFNDPQSEENVGGDGMMHTQAQQNVLARLTSFVNRRSLVGGKIADLLESVFGIPKGDVLDDSNPFVGSAVLDVEFSDVFSTAETQQGSLGEYAGKASAAGDVGKFNVNCSSPGLVLAFSCLVPRTQKVQGINPCLFHTRSWDYYNPMFDGVTLLPTNKLSLYCVDSLVDNYNSSTPQSFGNQSLFAEYKTRSQGILNGDLSLLSTKSTYDSFTMDQTIANYVTQDPIGDDGSVDFVVTSPNVQNCVAGTMWRYIGRWLWLGNFDRIFVNQRQIYSTDYSDYSNVTWMNRDTHVTDDNLIIHSIVDLKINAPMLPLEDSYMTRDINELSSDRGERAQSE